MEVRRTYFPVERWLDSWCPRWRSYAAVSLLGLTGVACTTVDAAPLPTLVPTINIPPAETAIYEVQPETITSSPVAVATLTPIATPEPLISSTPTWVPALPVLSHTEVYQTAEAVVRGTDAARSERELDGIVDRVPESLQEASVAVYARRANGNGTILAGTATMVECGEGVCVGITANHVLQRNDGQPLQYLRLVQPQTGKILTTEGDNLLIQFGPGDVGVFGFRYWQQQPFTGIGREALFPGWEVDEAAQFSSLLFSEMASRHNTVYPLVGYGLDTAPWLHDESYGMLSLRFDQVAYPGMSGGGVMEHESEKLVGIVYAIIPNMVAQVIPLGVDSLLDSVASNLKR